MVKTPVRLTAYALYQRPDCLVSLTTGGGENLLLDVGFEDGSGWNERPDPQHPATAFYRGGELVKPRDNGQVNENVYLISNLACCWGDPLRMAMIHFSQASPPSTTISRTGRVAPTPERLAAGRDRGGRQPGDGLVGSAGALLS